MNIGERPFFRVDTKSDVDPKRPTFAAVPLDPWTGEHPEHPGKPYYTAALEKIERLTVSSFDKPAAQGLNPDLKAFVLLSLLNAQTQRVQHNSDNPISEKLRAADPQVERACNGYATPAELLSIFLKYPQFQAIELAKLSHPFDTAATEEMTDQMTNLLVDQLGARYPIDNPHYKIKRNDPEIPALVVVRKASSHIDLPDGSMHVVERKSLLLRGDPAVVDEFEVERQKRHLKLLSNVSKFGELSEKLESILKYDELPVWLQPLTTSYYIYRDK